MNCKFCNQPLGETANGAFVCPNCGNINYLNTLASSPVISQSIATAPSPKSYTALSSKSSSPKWKLIIGAVSVVVIIGLLAGELFYQTAQAKNYLKLAKNDIGLGKYAEADNLLSKADKYYALGGVKPEIKKTKVQNKNWTAYKGYLNEAKDLVVAGKLSEASSKLDRIGKDFPTYSQVTQLYRDISTKTEASRKIAAPPQPTTPSAPQSSAKAATPKTKTIVPSPNPAPPFTTSIHIRGDAACQSSTLEALQLLSQKAAVHYSTVVKYIGIIECVPSGSGIYAYESPTRYVVGDATRNGGTVWYAGTIAHDAGHSKLYNDYLASHPGQPVPNDVWIGESAEVSCLNAQYDALTKIGASQYQLDYVQNVINTQYYSIPYDQRWW
ncbi:hypothetical protein COU91_01390 [Candidatus Saccharibacteria bacterium CG10_big_fil_rev_8_21_14_0_10_47_8]|nr:MAG: hypothetical protein COU91_01390 [Candidatus Saccharibacteria bacterium CG10_big_fil_rev_8_21_14_0_10_47_8]